ncbi:hypothetical protein BU24DRAFT_487807 [Aaosphaeria arxii CBS 175.79]|uniref:Uncharacterized protein n=1 Tax=Aaosphaeria arxii CBS 175.79 TaxID=1450172 RepID=A0A6A5Y733_9PLEO|nr:uncharacterized protein BU24DRAFT_487807 [Aaosphaeria arxii CBS 175.79]KAF2021372.1 hypothetical protein BU24DRAFT_487807 [Aaosphaeria arxii CBS 175.79]
MSSSNYISSSTLPTSTTHTIQTKRKCNNTTVPCSTTPSMSTQVPKPAFYAKPFDRFVLKGGGAQHDIFRRFKIRPAEEEDFLIHWSQNRVNSGIFSRDEGGTLEFRISSSDASNLSKLGIGGREGCFKSGVQWTHVYDEEGVSWLTQVHWYDSDEWFPKV